MKDMFIEITLIILAIFVAMGIIIGVMYLYENYGIQVIKKSPMHILRSEE